MRIMFVIPTLGTGGAERVASILANYLSEDNIVEFFIMEQSEIDKYQTNDRVMIKEASIAVKRGSKVKAIVSYGVNFAKQRSMLSSEILCFKPEIVISFLPKADLLVSTLVNKRIFKWVSSERNDPKSRSRIEQYILKKIYKKTDVLVCQTKTVSNFYIEQGIRRTYVIHNPLILEEFLVTKASTEIEEKYIVSVGRLDKQKNFEMLINAFAIAKRRKKFEEKLYIIGSGPDEGRLLQLIKKLNLETEVFLLGRKKNVFKYLLKAKLFVLSSDYEGLPNVMLEAMAAGLPIISTDYFTGAAREFIDNNGIVVRVGDIDEMTNAIEIMINKSDEELANMGLVSKNKVKNLDAISISKQWAMLLASI